MNWSAQYERLVQRAALRTLEGYGEWHHVTPRCLGGSDDACNLVKLSAREHYVAHLLLVKMHPGNRQLVFAAHMMTVDSSGRRIGNRKYEWLRRLHSIAMSEAKKGNQYWLGRRHSDETRSKLAASSVGGPGRTGLPWDEIGRKKLSEASIGRQKSMAHRNAMAVAKRDLAKEMSPYSDGSPRVPGITQRKNGSFVARSWNGEKRVYVGFFKTLKDAAAALDGKR